MAPRRKMFLIEFDKPFLIEIDKPPLLGVSPACMDSTNERPVSGHTTAAQPIKANQLHRNRRHEFAWTVEAADAAVMRNYFAFSI